MFGFLRWYRHVNILSLDIALGAVICATFFAKLISAEIWIYGKIALGLTVWIIYTADHLRDARTVKSRASSERHRFHQDHFKIILIVMFVAMIFDLVMISFMRKSLLYYGFALSGVVLLYLLVTRYLKMLKEIFIALIYTCGVMLPALSDQHHMLGRPDVLFMFNFFLVVLINLLVFSWFDVEKDVADGHQSFATIFGREFTKRIVFSLVVIILIVSAYLLLFFPDDVSAIIILLMMTATLVIIIQKSKSFFENERFRFLGDAVFLFPVIYLLINS